LGYPQTQISITSLKVEKTTFSFLGTIMRREMKTPHNSQETKCDWQKPNQKENEVIKSK